MGGWLSWLERLAYIEKARGSNPLPPTKIFNGAGREGQRLESFSVQLNQLKFYD